MVESQSSRLDPAAHPWMQIDGIRRILSAIQQARGEARFVGGAVRDALLGKTVVEIDLACTLPPEKIIEALKAAQLKFAPTGIEHGTVTAIADHKGYEITTLRRDVETYGRKAKVEFTDDWQADAARRDFTMNALYADANGAVYDYFDGRSDLTQGHVRFIGNANDRIKEDILRILRFFRFYAWFGRGPADVDGLKACRELAGLIPQLSVERVWREIAKLLAADNPIPSWGLVIEHNILPHVIPEASNIARLGKAYRRGKEVRDANIVLGRLTALLPPDAAIAARIAYRLKMSNRESEFLQKLAPLPGLLRDKSIPALSQKLYQYGADLCREAALLLAAEEPAGDFEPALAEASGWQKPVFPLQGEDILKLGVKPGPKVGEVLRQVEEWWIASDFRPTAIECRAEAQRYI